MRVSRGLTPVILALLVIVIVIVFALPGLTGAQSATPVASPRAARPAEAALLALPLPRDVLPQGSANTIVSFVSYISIDPGVKGTVGDPCCPGPLVEYVISGTYSVRAQIPLQVIRAGGRTEEISAATTVTLGSGDALLARSEAAVEVANTGSEPVEVLSWSLIGNSAMASGRQLSGAVLYDDDIRDSVKIRPVDAILRLRRLTLGPGETLPVSDTLTLAVAAGGNIGKSPDGSIRNNERTAAEVYVLTLEQTAPGVGTPTS